MDKELFTPGKKKMRVAIFMSGSGSNARAILDNEDAYEVSMIFTDRESNAEKIAQEYHKPYYYNDLNEFCKERNAQKTDLSVRADFDRETATLLEKEKVDVVALCGYMSIVTEEIHEKWLTINVHPADLTKLEGNKRVLAGCMGSECISKARELGENEVKSTTHIVTSGVDEGAILMVSEGVAIGDDKETLEMLKIKGDHKIYPETLRRLAQGDYYESEGVVVSVEEEKKTLREGMQRIRDELKDSDSGEITKRILEEKAVKESNTILIYSSMGSEVGTENLLNELLGSKEVALPSTEERGIVARKVTGKDQLKPGKYGILEAVGEEINPENIDVVVVPGLAFDAKGNRVGYGLGYYDKFLKKTTATKIGICFDRQIIDKIWVNRQDVAMDIILTDERRIEVGA